MVAQNNRKYSKMHSLLQVAKLFNCRVIRSKVHPRLRGFIATCFLGLLLAGCATTDERTVDVENRDVLTQSDDTDAFDEGQVSVLDDTPVLVASDVEAQANARRVSQAEYYQRQAQDQASSDARVDATLSSAEYFVQANEHRRAADLVNSIRPFINTKEHLDRAAIVLAYADYSEGNCSLALARLDPLVQRQIGNSNIETEASGRDSEAIGRSPNNTDDDRYDDIDQEFPQREYIDASKTLDSEGPLSTQQVDALLLSSFCYQASGDYENALSALIRRESALYGASRAETTRYLWQVINTIPLEQRQALAEQSQNASVRNRVQQSLRGEIGDTVAAPQQFAQWREEPSIPASNIVVDNAWGIDSPKSVFVLLPLSSRFSKAAEALKAGIEREHLANESPYRPDLRYYDIGDNPLQVGQYYAAAVRAGADFVIGPIGKSFSNEANNTGGYNQYTGYNSDSSYGSRAPMLLLGGDQALTAGNLRLSMSPESEGRKVAERAWNDGHLSAGVLLANDANSQRALSGFTERWLALGGKLSKTIEYSAQQFDHSVELKQLFDISRSEYRHRQLSQTLGFKPKFSPYQRGDIDFVFMVAKTQTGRIVRPQINFFTNSQVPVYATSAIYNGIEDSINNIDLDNTLFPVMPWVVRSSKVAQYAGQLNMVHAMGMDAYRVASSVKRLRSQADAALNGNMGQLQLRPSGEIDYQPVWAKFDEGVLTVVDTRGLDITPLELDISDEQSLDYSGDLNQPSNRSNSQGSYNDQNWDSGESRRKTGG